jgi:hypothetical protein
LERRMDEAEARQRAEEERRRREAKRAPKLRWTLY